MKRRDLLKAALYSAPITVTVADVFAANDALVVGENHLTYDPISGDVNDFKITVTPSNKTIDIAPLNLDTPFLTVAALHRHLQDLSDRVFMSGDVLDIMADVISYRVSDDMIGTYNNWVITERGLNALFGTVIINDKLIYSVGKLLGVMDNNLTHDLHIADMHGNKFYHNNGIFSLRFDKTLNTRMYLRYKSYKNLHMDELGNSQTGVWVDEEYMFTAGIGMIPLPITSMG